jgi:hypothetical protein
LQIPAHLFGIVITVVEKIDRTLQKNSPKFLATTARICSTEISGEQNGQEQSRRRW